MSSPTASEIDQAIEGSTIARQFLANVQANGSSEALRWMLPDGGWDTVTFDQVAERASRAAAALRALGVGPGDRVVLMMRNIPDFHWWDLGALFVHKPFRPEELRAVIRDLTGVSDDTFDTVPAVSNSSVDF